MDIAILIEDETWQNDLPDPEATCRRAAEAALESGGSAVPANAELCLVLSGDDRVRELNARFRGKDTATNVLSFPAYDSDAPVTGAADMPVLLGDVVLAHGVVSREAREQGKAMADHLSHLVVHGVLHLLGHDHMTEQDADRMEALETGILAGLGVSDPYQPAGVAPMNTSAESR
jgi:probable rRNA maturation factor